MTSRWSHFLASAAEHHDFRQTWRRFPSTLTRRWPCCSRHERRSRRSARTCSCWRHPRRSRTGRRTSSPSYSKHSRGPGTNIILRFWPYLTSHSSIKYGYIRCIIYLPKYIMYVYIWYLTIKYGYILMYDNWKKVWLHLMHGFWQLLHFWCYSRYFGCRLLHHKFVANVWR